MKCFFIANYNCSISSSHFSVSTLSIFQEQPLLRDFTHNLWRVPGHQWERQDICLCTAHQHVSFTLSLWQIIFDLDVLIRVLKSFVAE